MSPIDPLYFTFLVTGFTVGFGHCFAMCGPIMVSLSLNLKNRGLLIPHLLYNTGRILTYAILGGIAGLTGSFAGLASSLLHIQKGALIAAGVMVLLMGLAMGGWIPHGWMFKDNPSLKGVFSRGFRKLSSSKSSAAYLFMGLLLGLLPCGPVYTALVASTRAGMLSGSPMQGFTAGAGVMLMFGIGTAPALLLVGKLAGLGWLKSRELIYMVGALLMVLVGIYFIVQGIRF